MGVVAPGEKKKSSSGLLMNRPKTI